MAMADPAFAIGEVSSPNVTKGKLAVEYGVTRTFDTARDTAHELELKYGATDRVRPELKLELDDASGKSATVKAVELSAQYQLFARGENWADSAIKVGYAHKPHDPEALKAKLLLEKKVGGFTHRSTISAAQEIGQGAQAGGVEVGVQWSSRYAVLPELALGFEVDSDFAQFDGSATQKHYAGPAVYGKLNDRLSYEAAYFVGLNRAAADGAAFVIVEYAIPF